MDCEKFDGQVVRLEGITDLADKFIRVRLDRIDSADLNVFEFDYDLTFMVFFLNADERIYGRFGGRDAKGPDTRQSLAGLHHAMAAALETHGRGVGADEPAPPRPAPRFIREVRTGRRTSTGCIHCHEVKEILHAELEKAGQWDRDRLWRYPLPDNLGLILEIDRGNVVRRVELGSPAAHAGLRAGDVIQQLHGLPVHSFADAQFALDRAPKAGVLDVSWRRAADRHTGKLTLPEGWRKTDLSWRPSLQKFVPSVRLYGPDLSVEEKKVLGLSAKQLAFQQEDRLHSQAQEAGIRAGDIVLGVENKQLDMDVREFYWYVRGNYLIGDRVTVNLLRNGQRLNRVMKLQ